MSNETQLFNSLLQNYDKDASPSQITGQPTDVRISLYMMHVEIIDGNSKDMSFTAYLRMAWEDPRLKHPNVNGAERKIRLPEDSWKKIWIPDIFIRAVIKDEFHDMVTPNRFLSLNSSGSLFYVMKVSAESVCISAADNYPFETVKCQLPFESFGYRTDSLTISSSTSTPIEITSDLQLGDFEILNKQFKDCTQSYTSGTFPCLEFSFYFKRVSSFVSRVFIPSAAVVILSWISFWIDGEAAVARLLTGFLSLIAMTLISIQGLKNSPRTSYATLMDTWLSVCFIFVFASLLEYLSVVIASRKRSGTGGFGEMVKPSLEQASSDGGNSKAASDGRRAAIWIDWTSRIAFPVAFSIFVLVFALIRRVQDEM